MWHDNTGTWNHTPLTGKGRYPPVFWTKHRSPSRNVECMTTPILSCAAWPSLSNHLQWKFVPQFSPWTSILLARKDRKQISPDIQKPVSISVRVAFQASARYWSSFSQPHSSGIESTFCYCFLSAKTSADSGIRIWHGVRAHWDNPNLAHPYFFCFLRKQIQHSRIRKILVSWMFFIFVILVPRNGIECL